MGINVKEVELSEHFDPENAQVNKLLVGCRKPGGQPYFLLEAAPIITTFLCSRPAKI